jgi:CRISPR-associated protein Cmr3
MNRPLRIGGWDFVAKKDKPMWAFAPAGSVYYFEAEGEVSYTGEPVTEYGGQIGYGEVLFGKWDYVKEG